MNKIYLQGTFLTIEKGSLVYYLNRAFVHLGEESGIFYVFYKANNAIITLGDYTGVTDDVGTVFTSTTELLDYLSTIVINAGGLTQEQYEVLSHLSVVDGNIVADTEFYATQLNTSPGTLRLGNVLENSASHGLGIKNTINNKTALLNFQVYNETGVLPTRMLEAGAEFDRVMFSDDTQIQPTTHYEFDVLANQPYHELIKKVKVIPSEAGTLSVIIKGKSTGLPAIEVTREVLVGEVDTLIEIEFSNGVIFEVGDLNTIELNGVKLKGGDFTLGPDTFFVPYSELVEHYITYEEGATRRYVDEKFDFDIISARLSVNQNVLNTEAPIAFDVVEYNQGITQSAGVFTIAKEGYYKGHLTMFIDEDTNPSVYVWVDIKPSGGAWANIPNSLIELKFSTDAGNSIPLLGDFHFNAGDQIRVMIKHSVAGGTTTLTNRSISTSLGTVSQPGAHG